MPTITKIESSSLKLPSFFFSKKNKNITQDDRCMGDIIKTQGPSEVSPSRNNNLIIKLVKSRSFHERFKALWLHSRLHKEIRGNYFLKKLGIRVPEIFESGYNPSVLWGNQFIGYYIMEDLRESGFSEFEKSLKAGALSNKAIEIAFNNILIDIKNMAENKIVYSDLHLGNIMIDSNSNIAWIDTGVSHYHFGRKRKFNKKFKDSINRLLKQKPISDIEKEIRKRIEKLLELDF